MEKADLGGTIIEYEARGAGEPVILIHGSVLADTMKLLMDEDALFSRYRLIRYHRRGYLGTTHSPPPVSIVDQALDCLDLIRHLGISHAHLVGHSYGGVIAIAVALQDPAVVHTLSLLEPALIGMVPSGAGFGSALTPAGVKYQSGSSLEAINIFLELVSGPQYRVELERVIPGALEAAAPDAATFFEIEMPAIRQFWGTFSREQAASIRQPILAAVGTTSELPLREGHNLIREWFKLVETLEVKGGNHLFPVTQAKQVAEGLTDFLAGHHPIM
jgi:pimeloyl-ACP methyl ester carboxylesterase